MAHMTELGERAPGNLERFSADPTWSRQSVTRGSPTSTLSSSAAAGAACRWRPATPQIPATSA
jgi:hypothetical protein